MAKSGLARGVTLAVLPLAAAATLGVAAFGLGEPGVGELGVSVSGVSVSGVGVSGFGVSGVGVPGIGGSAERPPGAAAAVEPAGQVPDGAVLMKQLGCGACHAGVPEGDAIREVAPAFGEGAAPLAPAYIFHYLDDPQTVRPEIAPARMPRYDLTERERLALALFVTSERELRGVDDALGAAMARHPDADRDEGGALFETLNCRGCHVHPDFEARADAPDLGATGLRVREEWLAGYLASPVPIRPAGTLPGRGDRMPDFRLSADEVESIGGFLLTLRSAPPGPGATPAPTTPTPAPLPPWEPLALSPFSMRKAETLLRDRWSCLGCHQLGDGGGRIGPRLDGVAERLRPEYLRHLIANPGHLAPGTVMPASMRQPDRLDLVASFLLLRGAPWSGSERLAVGLRGALATPAAAPERGTALATAAAAPERGAALFAARCASCHGVAGAGDGFNAPFLPVAPTALADSAAMSLRPDDTLYDGVHAGGWILGRSHRMPAFGASLDDGQKRGLVAYIRALCRCQGPAWSRDGRRGP